MGILSPEKGPSSSGNIEKSVFVVKQPDNMKNILDAIQVMPETEQFSETTGEDSSGDLKGSGHALARKGTSAAVSTRAQAIANLPDEQQMRRELKKQIEAEVKRLHKEIRTLTRIGKPGTAFYVNQLYAKIRGLNAFLSRLVEESFDVLKRVFIRVFIDRQPIL
jgi:hypothetical protein